MLDILKNILKNEIIISWVAPIITGVVVALIIRLFKVHRDEKTVFQSNQRYIDAIMPFIIQKTEIKSEYISDTRKVIVDESGLKNKYVYTELALRNKLIVDICESNFIDEKRKKELIDFTYECFKSFEKIENKESKDDSESKKTNGTKLLRPIVLLFASLIVSQMFLILILYLYKGDVNPEDNILLALPLFQGIISLCAIVFILITKIPYSGITRKRFGDELISSYYSGRFKKPEYIFKIDGGKVKSMHRIDEKENAKK